MGRGQSRGPAALAGLLLAVLAAGPALVQAQANHATDMAALLAFKRDAANANNAALLSWTDTVDPCIGGWGPAVACKAGRISSVLLGFSGLQGTIPSEIGTSLAFVEVLDLSSNAFTGTIPLLGQTGSSLQKLDLSSNNLTGTLPSGWSALTSLTQLNVSGNPWDTDGAGTAFPAAWSALSSLVSLDMSRGSNSATGTVTVPIPVGWATGAPSMSSLQHFVCRGCQLSFTLPDTLASFPQLSHLDLSSNPLIGGSIPASFGSSVLQNLKLRSCGLAGDIPSTFASGVISNTLHSLDLGHNSLQLELNATSTLAALPSLWELFIDNNPLVTGGNWQYAPCVFDVHNTSSVANNTFVPPTPCRRDTALDVKALFDWRSTWMSMPAGLQGWGYGATPAEMCSTWTGVTCNPTTQRVTSIDLSNLVIMAPAGQSLGSVDSLQQLRLRGCGLAGPVPGAWGQLKQLSALDVSSNQLTGTLPAEWAGMAALESLVVAGNAFYSTLPAAWTDATSSLSKLKQLDASYAGLYGTLPAWTAFAPVLQDLQLHGNALQGSFGQVFTSQLQTLKLGVNNLTGVLGDTWMESSPLLQTLSLHDNPALGGTLPAVWSSNGTAMATLDLSGTAISGTIPASYASWGIKCLQLQRNAALCGAVPEDLPCFLMDGTMLGTNCGNGAILQSWGAYYGYNKPSCRTPSASCPLLLSPTDPYSWSFERSSGLTADARALDAALRVTGWPYNPWPHPVPCQSDVYMHGLACDPVTLRVTKLDLSAVTAGSPTATIQLIDAWRFAPLRAEWAGLTHLQQLRFPPFHYGGSSPAPSPLPAEWSALTQLKALMLGGMRLTGTVPASWSAFTNLSWLDLQQPLQGGGSSLTGPMPDAWANLTHLDIANNTLLAGTPFPAAWEASTNLTFLRVRGCGFTGTLPSFGAAAGMSVLDLAGNAFQGTLPASWASLSGLTVVDLAGNNVSGTLPTQWSALNLLSVLDLSHGNSLTGTLPEGWSNMTSLNALRLSRNNFTGTLPASWHNISNPGAYMPLQEFRCSHCNLTGNIPAWGAAPGLCNQALLQTVDLRHNQLTGALPAASMATWTTAQALLLGGNNLTSYLPSPWTNGGCGWPAMLQMDFGRNNFSGTLPAEWWRMTQLQTLDVASNNLTGTIPDYFYPSTADPSASCTVTADANAPGGYVGGISACPSPWPYYQQGGMTYSLRELYLDSNKLTGTVPVGLMYMGSLDCITVHSNPGMCGAPVAGTHCYSRRNTSIGLDCTSGQLLPKDPSWFCQQPTRSYPYINGDQHATAPPYYPANIQPYDSTWPQLAAQAPQTSAAQAQCAASRQPPVTYQADVLKTFRAGFSDPYNGLSSWLGDDPCDWSWARVRCDAQQRVIGLDLSGDSFFYLQLQSSANWTALTQLPYLTTLKLGALRMNQAAFPAELANLTGLTELDLTGAKFAGTLPAEWSTLVNLTRLVLDGNRVVGSLPVEFGTLTHLDTLQCQTCQLGGDVLDFLSNSSSYVSLRVLNLRDNHLNGTLPASLSSRNLTTLNLAQNNVSGPLPDDWANATVGGVLRQSLQYLMLNGNNLTGSIPASYGSGGMLSLARLTLYQNPQLCGLPPSGALCLDSSMTSLNLDCSTGAILSSTQLGPSCVPQAAFGNQLSPMENYTYLYERDGLLSLKTALGAPAFTATWGLSVQDLPCGSPRWLGLPCAADGHVYTLNLSALGLAGPLPYTMYQLPLLTALDLSNNAFTGELPASWGSLNSLQELRLQNNMLTGTLPASWQSMWSLKSLNMSYNTFRGGLPVEWHNPMMPNVPYLPQYYPRMYALQHLSCTSCGLNGTLPNWNGPTSLLSLRLAHNAFNGSLPAWSGISTLQHLDVSFNKLTGFAPPGWSPINSLVTVQLQGNLIQQDLSTNWLSAQWLSVLDVSQNKLFGALPSIWGDPSCRLSTTLTKLNLGLNQLTGPLPDTWGSLSSLTSLSLNNNPLSGNMSNTTLPASIQSVSIANTNLTGNLPYAWGSLPSLSCLLVFNSPNLCGVVHENLPCLQTDGTKLGTDCALNVALPAPVSCKPVPDACLPALAEGTALLNWKVSVNDTAGKLASWSGIMPCSTSAPWAGVTCDAGYTMVVSVNVSGFGLSGPLGGGLGSLTKLQVLDISGNSLTGTLSSQLAQATGLVKLHLGHNALVGPMPTAWSGLTQLKSLVLDGNPLQASIPSAWGAPLCGITPSTPSGICITNTPYMSALSLLSCNGCALQGSLPSMGLPALTQLLLPNNNLSGTLPPLVAPLMQALVLDNNTIEGTLFEGMTQQLRLLQVLSMAGNKLNGTLPAGFANFTSLSVLNLANNSLSGPLPSAWSNSSYPLRSSLQTLLLSRNSLNGSVASDFGASMTALGCWSVSYNPSMCGRPSPSMPCTDFNGTAIGHDCTNGTLLDNSTYSCTWAAQTCPVPGSVPAFYPSYADIAPLLTLKAGLGMRDGQAVCSGISPGLCAILTSWSNTTLPCSSANCAVCSPTATNCGKYDASISNYRCAWRQIGCRNQRVSRVLLDFYSLGIQNVTLTQLPHALVNLTALEDLQIWPSSITNGTLLPELSQLSQLTVLRIAAVGGVNGSLPSEWSVLSKLQQLYIYGASNVKSTLPSAWSAWGSTIQSLKLEYNGVIGALPDSWSNFTALKTLYLYNNAGLNGTIPATWNGAMANLTNVRLAASKVEVSWGSLHSWLDAAGPKLLELGLSANMTGKPGLDTTFPNTFPNLTTISIRNMDLGGSVPDNWQYFKLGLIKTLQLSGIGLNGSLPSWLNTVVASSADAVVDLSYNALSGSLPGSWGNSTYAYLMLGRNKLSGAIPANWLPLISGTGTVDLGYNALAGALPASWFFNVTTPPSNFKAGSLFKLRTLVFTNNTCLCGGVPSWAIPAVWPEHASYSNFTNFNTTCEATPQLGCGINIPAEWTADVPAMMALKAAASNTTSAASALSTWQLGVPPCTLVPNTGDCVLCSDYLPTSTCGTMRMTDGQYYCIWRHVECRSRHVVRIVMQGVHGLGFTQLPASLANLTQLEVFDLMEAQVAGGVLPTEYSAWTNLTTFRVNGPITGQLPSNYSAWSKLSTFELQATGLTGTFPAAYPSSWPLLQNLAVDGAAISGYMPDMSNCTKLAQFIVQHTPVTSDAAHPLWLLNSNVLASMTSLKFIGIGGTKVQLPTWTELKQALSPLRNQLQALSLPSLGLSGTIGPLGDYFAPALQMLDLSGNQFNGVLPPDFSSGAVTGFKYLNLSGNALRGTLPPGLLAGFAPGNVSDGLDLSNNILSGPLPDAWGSSYATTFRSVSLANNYLNGSIPASWSALVAAAGGGFNLSANQLTGNVPVAWSTPVSGPNGNFTAAVFNNTCLWGAVPQQWSANGTNTAFWSTGTSLTSSAPACCPACAPGPPAISSPDVAGLMLLKAALASPAGALDTWNGGQTPCSDIAASCIMCTSAADCGTASRLLVSAYYCNYQYLTCTEGRVTQLDFTNSQVTFNQLPSNLTLVDKLQTLVIAGGAKVLSGPLPAEWSAFTKLSTVHIHGSGSNFGALPSSWKNMPAIADIGLAHMNISAGILAPGWTANPSITRLNFTDITLSGSQFLPSEWGTSANLTWIELNGVRGLVGKLPATWVSGLPALNTLILSNMPWLSSTLGEYLTLVNQASRQGAAGSTFTGLGLVGMGLSGPIPPEMFVNKGLVHLNLAYNALNGTLADIFATMTALNTLDLSHNSLASTLPAAWASMRTAATTGKAPEVRGVSINLSSNAIFGTLPPAWGVSTGGMSMALTALDVSNNLLAGSLPDSWSTLSVLATTALNVSHNQMEGGIPASWETRTVGSEVVNGMGSGWSLLDFSANKYMCGSPVPAWFFSRMVAYNTTQLLAGTSLGSTCVPAIYDFFLNAEQAAFPTTGTPTNLTLRSLTSYSSAGTTKWHMAVMGPAAKAYVDVGTMVALNRTDNGQSFWGGIVTGNVFDMPGNYSLRVTSEPAGLNITNSPLVVQYFAGEASAANSNFNVSTAPNSAAIGAVATVTMVLHDAYGVAALTAKNVQLVVSGSQSGNTTLGPANFTRPAAGTFTYNHTLVATEAVTFYLTIGGAAVSPVSLSVRGVAPAAVAYSTSVLSSLLQLDSGARVALKQGSTRTVSAKTWHVLYLPVLLAPSAARPAGGNIVANPWLNATVAVSQRLSNGSLGPAKVFGGYWSWTNGSYVLPFKLANSSAHSVVVTLGHMADAQAKANMSFQLTGFSDLAVPANSNLTLVANGTRAGDIIYVVAWLGTKLNGGTYFTDNVKLSATGRVSGSITLPALQRQQDGSWVTSFVPRREENITLLLTVSGTPSGYRVIPVAGRSPFWVDYPRSLASATLLCQGMAQTLQVAPGGAAVVYVGENSYVSVPVQDLAGISITMDPGLKVMLTLIPAQLANNIMAQYGFSNGTAPRRRLATTATTPPSLRMVNSQTGWIYMSDYASEAPDLSALDQDSLPINYTFPQLGVNASFSPIQDALAALPTVYSSPGVYSAFKHAYQMQLWPAVAQDYVALLSLRHPLINGTFALTQFTITATANPATAVAQTGSGSGSGANATTSTSSLSSAQLTALIAASGPTLNPLVNPQVAFTATFPKLAAASYGGVDRVLADFNAIVASVAVLDSDKWVVSSVAAASPLAVKATVWFPSNYTSIGSVFGSLSGFEYFLFLLNKLPELAFTNQQYISFMPTGVTISNFTKALPGTPAVSGIAKASDSNSGSSATASPASLKVVDIDVSSLVVAPTTPSNAPPAVDLSTIVDKTPPVITLQGDAYVEVLQATSYSDAGVSVYDNIDGYSLKARMAIRLCTRPKRISITDALPTDNYTLSCTSDAYGTVNTSLPTSDQQGFVVSYGAKDTANNEALPVRRWVVVTARCSSPERWCPELQSCSVNGKCNKLLAALSSSSSSTGSSSASAPAVVKAYVAPVDRTPPKLTLLGNGTAAITATGAVIMLENATWNSVWSDPGASAVDAVDGNLTTSIQSYGAGAVDTSKPTATDKKFGFVVEYFVEDRSHNAAPTARRLITVVCPGKEQPCTDPDTGAAICTTDGQCGKPAALSATSTSISSSGSSSSSAASTQQQQVPATPPTLSLQGPSVMQITAGDVYDRCSSSAGLDAVCDRGATASDTRDGVLDRLVTVCGSSFKPSGNARAVPILLACNITSTVAGSYTIVFAVTNSAGMSSNATRQLIIKPNCPDGESLCPDKVTCSEAGACISSSPSSSSSSSSSSGSTTTSSSSTRSSSAAAAAAAVSKVAANQAPNVTLLMGTNFSSVAYVRRSGNYDPCAAGIRPTSDVPCEPGANATDPDGGPDGQGLDLTANVVVCPPAECLSKGCSPDVLRSNYFSVKGLQGCGIDTMAAVGTQFAVDFWAWDAGSPALNGSAVRTVVLTTPCPSASAPHFCQDNNDKYFCSGTPCDQLQQFLTAAKLTPVLSLLPGSGTVYIRYGSPAPFSLNACPNGTQNSSCGAVAWDTNGAGAQVADLTGLITVQEQSSCEAGQADCISCDVDALSVGAQCLPGTYKLIYSITNDDGTTASATRTVIVYQAGTVTSTFVLYKSMTNGTAAADIVEGLRNSTSAAYTDAVDTMREKLGDTGSSLDASNVEITDASVVNNGPQNNDVVVTATIYIYYPSVTTRSGINSTMSSSSSRRLLELGTDVSMVADELGALESLSAGQQHGWEIGTVSGGRRLLQSGTSGGSLSGSQSAMSGSLSSNLGASGVSSTSSTADVDLIQGYIAAIVSSIKYVEQSTSSLQTSSSAITTQLDQAFGDQQAQKEDTDQASLITSYQALLTELHAMVTSATVKTDTAAGLFDQQTVAATSLAAAMSDTITAMKESTALSAALLDKYLAQNVMLDSVTGMVIPDLNCSRGSVWETQFSVSSQASTTGNSMRRRLLASSSAAEQDWQGYVLASDKAYEQSGVDDRFAPERARYAGARGNRVVGGLFLHTTRDKTAASCPGGSFSTAFNADCSSYANSNISYATSANSSTASAYLARLFAGDNSDTHPYGTDPVFLRNSVLYQPDLADNVGDYYNVSSDMEVSATGAPYGFYHRELQGYARGFPILLVNRLTGHRSADMLQFLMDGNYLDKRTQGLTAELLTYNSDLRVLGYAKMDFKWQADGTVAGRIAVDGLPAIRGKQEGAGAEVFGYIVPLWIVTVWFVGLLVRDIMLKARDNGMSFMQAANCSTTRTADLILFSLMFIATVMFTVYAAAKGASVQPRAAYEVYDAPTLARARWLLPAKASTAETTALLGNAAADALRANLTAQYGSAPDAAGDVGRWALPSADGAYEEWASLMAAVHDMAGLWTAYGVVQGIVLLLLIVRMLKIWSFQSRLGIVCNTLLNSAPPLAHLGFIFVNVLVLLATLASVTMGYRSSESSSFGNSLFNMIMVLFGGDLLLKNSIVPDGTAMSAQEHVVLALMSAVGHFLLVFMIMNFMMAVIGFVFVALKKHAKGSPTIKTELRETVVPNTAAALTALLARARDIRSQAAPPALPAPPQSMDLLRVTGGKGITQRVEAEQAAAAAIALKHRVRAITVQRFDSPVLEKAAKQAAAAKEAKNAPAAADDATAAEDENKRYVDFMALQRALTELAQADPAMARALLSLVPSSLRHAVPGATGPGPVAESGRISAFKSAMSFAKQGAPLPDDNDFDSAPAGAYGSNGAAHDPSAAAAAAAAVANALLRRLGSLVDGNAAEERNVEADWTLMELAASKGSLDGDDSAANGVEAEKLLHRQIYGALWNAISAMERWSTAVARWQVKAVRETNAWLEANQGLILSRGGRVGGFNAVPRPALIDLTADAADADAHARAYKEQDTETAAALAAAEWRGQREAAETQAAIKSRAALDAAAAAAAANGGDGQVSHENSGNWGLLSDDQARSLGAISFHGLTSQKSRNDRASVAGFGGNDRASVGGIDFRLSSGGLAHMPSGLGSSRGSSSGLGSVRFDAQDSIGSSSVRSRGNGSALMAEDSAGAAPGQQRRFSRAGSTAGANASANAGSGRHSPIPEAYTSTSPAAPAAPAAAGIRALFGGMTKDQRSPQGSPTASMSDGELSPERSGGAAPLPATARGHPGRIAPLPAIAAPAVAMQGHQEAAAGAEEVRDNRQQME